MRGMMKSGRGEEARRENEENRTERTMKAWGVRLWQERVGRGGKRRTRASGKRRGTASKGTRYPRHNPVTVIVLPSNAVL
eukprot:8623709-Pyramimonas_sp.AAC.1